MTKHNVGDILITAFNNRYGENMDISKNKSRFSFEVDFLNGPIIKSIIIFAIPLFVSNIFQNMYNMVDTMIVGYYLGDNALAAIGSTAAIHELLIGFGFGIGNGLAVVTIKRDACGGCYNRIPPQRQAEVRLGKKIIVCEYCGRILVADPEEE